jgi:hypothetical protein
MPRNVVAGSRCPEAAGIDVTRVTNISARHKISTANSANIICISELIEGTPSASRYGNNQTSTQSGISINIFHLATNLFLESSGSNFHHFLPDPGRLK